MAEYLVKARPKTDLLNELKKLLDRGEIRQMRPFGDALHHSLENARMADDGYAIWEEEDYCTPPLAQERAAVLDTYFEDLSVQRVEKGAGWAEIEDLQQLWSVLRSRMGAAKENTQGVLP